GEDAGEGAGEKGGENGGEIEDAGEAFHREAPDDAMIAGLVLFEDEQWRDLRPLTDTLPVPALAFGGSTLGERWMQPGGVPLLAIEARPALLDAWPGRPALQTPPAVPSADVLAANAAAIPGPWLQILAETPAPLVLMSEGRLLAARI